MGKTLEECYEVLGLDSGATEDEIKSAYRQKALKCHPDKNPDDPLSTQKFQELGHAYRRLIGDEDSDDDGDYDDDDDDMDLWRDFFFFLFREEIINSRVRCKCNKCGSQGDEDDDFLASLAKEQEERQQFTEEEMAQFTSFENLKEQREANKRKFCNRNLSSSKPEQKTNKVHKPKSKSNKQLKHEQWKREKEITEIAAHIKPNTKVQEEKTPEKKGLDQAKSSIQPVAVDPGRIMKEQTDHAASNKRNTRKRRNRNKSRKQGDQETDFNQNNHSGSHRVTNLTAPKVVPRFAFQDAIRNVTIKPETTRRQDDVTGRLPHHTSYASPCVGNSAFSSPMNASQKQTEKGWFENPKPEAVSRPAYGANIWQKRQRKQQFLAELRPTNQTDEELQLQIALELSRKQSEIDAQQREITILEKQMEETLQIEKNLQLETTENDDWSKTALHTETSHLATSIDLESFPPLQSPLVCEQRFDVDEEWVVASDSEEEWGDNDHDDDESEGCVAKCRDPAEEHLNNGSASSSEVSKRDNVTLPKPDMQLPRHSRDAYMQLPCHSRDEDMQLPQHSRDADMQLPCHSRDEDMQLPQHSRDEDVQLPQPSRDADILLPRHSRDADMQLPRHFRDADMQLPQHSRDEGSQASDCCPYGHNCCLGKRCKYSHPVSTDKRKRQKSFDDSSGSEDKCDIAECESKDESNIGHNLPEKGNNISLASSSEELPISMSDNCDVIHLASSNGRSHSTSLFNLDNSMKNSSLEALQTETLAIDKLENVNQSLSNNIPGLESQEDGALSTQEKPKSNSANDEIKSSVCSDGVESINDGTSVECENSAPEDKMDLIKEKGTPAPTVDVVANSPFPANVPATNGLKQSATTMLHVSDLSASAKVQHLPQRTTQPVNYVKPLPVTMPANVIPQSSASAPVPQSYGHTALIPGHLPGTSQTSATPSVGNTPQTSETSTQSSTLESNTPAQPVTTNHFPAMPGFPLLPYGNLLPFLHPANVAPFNQNANASIMAAASLGGVPLPIMPRLSNGVQNPRGGGTVINPGMPPPYGTQISNGSVLSTPGHYLPVSPLNVFSGIPPVANLSGVGPHPLQSSQARLATNLQSTAQAVPQLNRLSGMSVVANMQGAKPHALQPSHGELATNPQSTAQAMPQLNGQVVANLQGAVPHPLQSSQAGLVTNSQYTRQAMSQMDGLSGMPVVANMQGAKPLPLLPSQAGLANNPQSTMQTMSQLNGSSGTPMGANMLGACVVQPSQTVSASNPQSSTTSIPQLPVNALLGMPNVLGTGPAQASQTGLTTIPQPTALDMSQLFRFPFPLFNPQAFVNMNMQMAAMGMPYLTAQKGCQTTIKSPSVLDASPVQVSSKSTETDRVGQVGSKTQKLAEVKLDIGEEKDSSGIGSKAPSLRRPSTVPKVIQHQSSI